MMAYDTLNVDLIIPFNHLNSILWQQVYTGDMPKNQPLLEDNLILMIKKWIDEGANGL